MKKTIIIISILLSLAVGFILGAYLTEQRKYEDLSFIVTSMSESILLNDTSTVQLLEGLYEKYESDPRSAGESVKRLMLVMYEENLIKTDLIGKRLGLDTRSFRINEQVERFIREHPLEECAESVTSEKFKCSFNVFKKSFSNNEH